MKFGFFTGFTQNDPNASLEETYAQGFELVELVDELGFDIVWFPEHHLTANVPSPAPLATVIEAANRTKRIRLGTGILITPYHHPLILAGQVTFVDHLTKGRLDVGFGRGGYQYEYARLGLTRPIAAARQKEGLEIILNSWVKADYSFQGEHYKFDASTVIPRPYQKPMPPTWLAARSTESMVWAAQHGLGVMMAAQRGPIDRFRAQVQLLDAICEDLGVDRPPISSQREVYITNSKADALKVAERIWENHAIQWHLHQDTADTVAGFTKYKPMPDAHYISPEEIVKRSVIGDVDTCIERIAEYQEIGFDQFNVILPEGIPHEEAVRTLSVFAERVMPRFDDGTPGRRPTPSAEPLGRTEPRPPVLIDTDGLGEGWMDWEAEQWLEQFDRDRAVDPSRNSRIFDFAAAPKVRAHADGSIDPQARLKRVSDIGCPECGRPVTAIYRRWANESDAEIRQNLIERMRELRWHELHTSR